MYKSETLKLSGLGDEEFFGPEDIDLSLRLKSLESL